MSENSLNQVPTSNSISIKIENDKEQCLEDFVLGEQIQKGNKINTQMIHIYKDLINEEVIRVTLSEPCSSEEIKQENEINTPVTTPTKRKKGSRDGCRIPPMKLTNPLYTKRNKIKRTMHLDDYEKCCDAKELIPHTVDNMSCLSDTNLEVLWFEIDNGKVYNWYGNISFAIDFKDILSKYRNLNLYYIDHVVLEGETLSRILLTEKPAEEISEDIIQTDFKEKGYPLWIDESDEYQYLIKHDREDKQSNERGHSVQIVIDAAIGDNGICKYLFSNCIIHAEDHAAANSTRSKGKRRRCFRFNQKKDPCPYPFSAPRTRDELDLIENKYT